MSGKSQGIFFCQPRGNPAVELLSLDDFVWSELVGWVDTHGILVGGWAELICGWQATNRSMAGSYKSAFRSVSGYLWPLWKGRTLQIPLERVGAWVLRTRTRSTWVPNFSTRTHTRTQTTGNKSTHTRIQHQSTQYSHKYWPSTFSEWRWLSLNSWDF